MSDRKKLCFLAFLEDIVGSQDAWKRLCYSYVALL